MAQFSLSLVGRALVVAACLAMSLASTQVGAAGRCEADSGGGCVRDGLACSPSSDAAPAGGRCYTVKQERVLKCLCLAKAPTSIRDDVRTTTGTGSTATNSTTANNGACVMKCDRAQIECRAQAKNEEEMLRCGRVFQACVADCNAPRGR